MASVNAGLKRLHALRKTQGMDYAEGYYHIVRGSSRKHMEFPSVPVKEGTIVRLKHLPDELFRVIYAYRTGVGSSRVNYHCVLHRIEPAEPDDIVFCFYPCTGSTEVVEDGVDDVESDA